MNDITQNIIIPNEIESISFIPCFTNIFSGIKFTSVIGIWESNFLDGSESFLTWKSISSSTTKYENSDIFFFISNSDELTTQPIWNGPFRNSEISLIDYTKRYIKIRCVLKQSGDPQNGYTYGNDPLSPLINSLYIKSIISGTASKFYTRTIDLGFIPQHILLTSETDIPEGCIIRYGISSIDTIKSKYYEFFDANKIVKLSKLPITGNKIKLFIEMSGNSGNPIVIHEISTMFSGNGQIFVNKTLTA